MKRELSSIDLKNFTELRAFQILPKRAALSPVLYVYEITGDYAWEPDPNFGPRTPYMYSPNSISSSDIRCIAENPIVSPDSFINHVFQFILSVSFDDFDTRLMAWMADTYPQKFGTDPEENLSIAQELDEALRKHVRFRFRDIQCKAIQEAVRKGEPIPEECFTMPL
jgi:hypothetical protein